MKTPVIRLSFPVPLLIALLCPLESICRAAADEAVAHADAPGAMVSSKPAVGGDYRISPRDLVQFQIFEEPDTLILQRVSASGEISVPMLGLVKVSDRTLREVEESAQKAYIERKFFVHPQVIVTVQAYAPRSISVLGQVNHPEQIMLPIEAGHIGIMQAITLAEGFTRLAKSDEVRVMRTVDGREEQHVVNIEGYLASKGAQADFQLRPDDIVFVPERVF